MTPNEQALADYFAGGIIPGSDILWWATILIVAAVALWQARIFISKF